MPQGQTVILPESEDEHLNRCDFCSGRTGTIDWSLTVAATDRRAVSVRLSDLRRMVGDSTATGELVVAGVNTRRQRWRSLMPDTIGSAPDYTFSQRSLHDRAALMGALRNSCAPAWQTLPYGTFRTRQVRKQPATETLLIGPPEEYFGWLDCQYCETYRYGSMRVAPHIPRQGAATERGLIIRVKTADIPRLLMKRPADAGLGQNDRSAASAHNLRDLLHALGVETGEKLAHAAMDMGEHTYVYPRLRP